MILNKASSSFNPPSEAAMARTTAVHPYFTPQVVAARPAAPSDFTLNVFSSRTLAGMLLAAALAALLVVADQLVDTWANGHLLVVWVAMWTIIFAAMALSARSLRHITETMAIGISRWAQDRAARRSDAAVMHLARQDHRVMRDLQAAMTRGEYEA
jgi:hypothetical protein